jgi:PIN domain nuclease of toxin-antitoxin system
LSRYLLDTHSLLWWWTDVGRLGTASRETIEQGVGTIFVSAASVWEIAIKTASGKLTEIEDFERDYGPLMASNGFQELAMTNAHVLKAGFLPGAHRDPFDRALAAQALTDNLTVITRDPEIGGFGCRTLW